MLKNKLNIALIISFLFLLFKINFFNDISQVLISNTPKELVTFMDFRKERELVM